MDQQPVVVYVKHRSPRSWRAKRLLRRKCYAFEVVEVSSESELPCVANRNGEQQDGAAGLR
jgi:hypothetical protein